MKFSIELTRQKALSPPDKRGWWSIITEPFTGAWQRNITESQGDLLCYPTLYACIARIAKDIGKLNFVPKRENSDGIWVPADIPEAAVLSRPNHYQNPGQFRESWIIAKLTQGNSYILKQRDTRGRVSALYVLDPHRVKPLVSESGDVFYELWTDNLNLLPQGSGSLVVPAREIIHDREMTLHHPLIGVPPLCAAHWPAVKNLKILRSSAEFFSNGAQPSGILTAPGNISDETAKRLSEYWNSNFTGDKAGRVAVVGNDLKFESLSTKSVDSQMVEQLRYSDNQICQPFGVPPFKVGIGTLPAGQKVDDINNLYYSDALQDRITHMEELLDAGLGISHPNGIELDLWPLLRMDSEKLARVEGEKVKASISTPNEARSEFSLAPLAGGDTVYMQQQNYSLEALSRRDAREDPFGGAPEEPARDDSSRELAMAVEKEMMSD